MVVSRAVSALVDLLQMRRSNPQDTPSPSAQRILVLVFEGRQALYPAECQQMMIHLSLIDRMKSHLLCLRIVHPKRAPRRF